MCRNSCIWITACRCGSANSWPWGRQRSPLWLGLRRTERARAGRLLELVRAGHLADRRLGDLSGGELRRVLLAAALAREPELLVLDEPAAGVDVPGERLLWEVLDATRREQGFTQLMVSHNLPLAAHYATHVICLDKRVFAQGPPRSTLTSATLLHLFGVPIHLYPDQCGVGDPPCPQCRGSGRSGPSGAKLVSENRALFRLRFVPRSGYAGCRGLLLQA